MIQFKVYNSSDVGNIADLPAPLPKTQRSDTNNNAISSNEAAAATAAAATANASNNNDGGAGPAAAAAAAADTMFESEFANAANEMAIKMIRHAKQPKVWSRYTLKGDSVAAVANSNIMNDNNNDDNYAHDDRAIDLHADSTRREYRFYGRDRLNTKQKLIFDYVMRNPHDIVLLQAGPGTGKTFTMLTIAHYITNRKSFEDEKESTATAAATTKDERDRHRVDTNLTDVYTVIFKKDLLYTYARCAYQYTVAAFMMRMLDIPFFTYVALDKQLSSAMPELVFYQIIVSLLKRAHLNTTFVRNTLLIFDEYTVISKPLLVVLLILLKYHRIGAIFCGDRNQLQNINNSKHSKSCASYSIVRQFAAATFKFDENIRCPDADHRKFIELLGTYASDTQLSHFGRMMLVLKFYPQLMTDYTIDCTVIACEHRILTNIVHQLVIANRLTTMFYYIDVSRIRKSEYTANGVMNALGLITPNACLDYMRTKTVGKFLPYLPLICGQRYFYNEFSERSQVILRGYGDRKIYFTAYDELFDTSTSTSTPQPQLLPLSQPQLQPQSSSPATATKTITKNVDLMPPEKTITELDRDQRIVYSCGVRSGTTNMFPEHSKYLLGDGSGTLLNFPIYPAQFMTIHMSQGRTINDKLAISFRGSTCTHQSVYVAVSRVRSPKQIVKIDLDTPCIYLANMILNCPELLTDGMACRFDADYVKRYMATNRVLWLYPNDNYELLKIIHLFLSATTYEQRLQQSNALRAIRPSGHYVMIEPPHSRLINDDLRQCSAVVIDDDRLKLDDVDDCNRGINDTLESVDESVTNNDGALINVIKYRDLFLALGCAEADMSTLWLSEFMLRKRELCTSVYADHVYTHYDSVISTLCNLNEYSFRDTNRRNPTDYILQRLARLVPDNIISSSEMFELVSSANEDARYCTRNEFVYKLFRLYQPDAETDTDLIQEHRKVNIPLRWLMNELSNSIRRECRTMLERTIREASGDGHRDDAAVAKPSVSEMFKSRRLRIESAFIKKQKRNAVRRNQVY